MDRSLRARPNRRDSTAALLHRLWRNDLHRQWRRIVWIVALTALMAGLTGLYPLVIKHAFDLFEDRDPRILYQVPALVIVLSSAKAAVQYVQNVQVQQMVLLTICDLQSRMFQHLTHSDLARLEREPPATLAARFTTDAAIIRDTLTRVVGGAADAVTVISLIGSMLWMDPVLSLIAALLYPLAAAPIQRIGKRVRRASGSMQEQMGETAAMLHESFAQARTVRAYGLEAAEEARAGQAFQHLYQALLRMTRSRSRVDPIMEVLGGAAVALVIGFSGWRRPCSVRRCAVQLS